MSNEMPDEFKAAFKEYEEWLESLKPPPPECDHKDNYTTFWDGLTRCSDCCKHEYKDHIDEDRKTGMRTCVLCSVILPYRYNTPIPKALKGKKKKKPIIPKIRLFDENGKQRREKYH